jgi:hypothetical protein
MKRTAPVKKIVGFALGSLGRSEHSIFQHLAALKIARKLEKIYQRAGMPVNKSIEIFAQDPAYTPNGIKILARFKPPITVLNDPQAFLVITSSTLMMACCPTVPVKQIVADLSAEDPSTRPAAIFWNNSEFDKQLGVDVVKYPVH